MRELKLDEARLDRLDEVLAFVDGILEALDCPAKIQTQLDIAVETTPTRPEPAPP